MYYGIWKKQVPNDGTVWGVLNFDFGINVRPEGGLKNG